MVVWLTSLISVVVGALIGVALEPAKSFLLERVHIRRMRHDLYIELVRNFLAIKRLGADPESSFSKHWFELMNFPVCAYYEEKDLCLFLRLADARGIQGLIKFFTIQKADLVSGKSSLVDVLKLLLSYYELATKSGGLDRGFFTVCLKKEEARQTDLKMRIADRRQ